MSNAKYSCVIPGCSEVKFYKSYVKHILSHSSEEIKNHFGSHLRIASKGGLLRVSPKVDKICKTNMACLGCYKMFSKMSLQENHKLECPNKKAHVDCCLKLLGESTTPSPTSDTPSPPSPPGTADEILRLKKLVDSLKKNADLDSDYINSFEKFRDIVFEKYPDIVEYMETNHSDIYDKIA